MPVLQLSCQQFLSLESEDPLLKKAARLTLSEFRLKAQAYNADGSMDTFSQLKKADGKANSLHYKCSFAIGHLMERLGRQIPDYTDSYGRPLPMETFRFELIESSFSNDALHKAAIYYYTPAMEVQASWGNQLLLRPVSPDPYTDPGEQSLLVELVKGIGVVNYTT